MASVLGAGPRDGPRLCKALHRAGQPYSWVFCVASNVMPPQCAALDPVNSGLPGMSKVVSEDCARRYFAAMSDEQSETWLRGQLRECSGPLLLEPWVPSIPTIQWRFGPHFNT